MEPILGLLGSGGGGGGGGIGGLNEKTALNTSKMEKDYMGIQKEAELELGLCLSLGGGGGAGGVKGKGSAAAWGEYGRILTAKDFPNGFCAGTKRERAVADSDVEAGTAASTGVSSQVVGWPPIRAYRMNTLVNQVKNSSIEEDKGVGGNEKNENSKKKINHGSNKNDTCTKERIHPWFVKVNMDGLQIGRKVDLNAHTSYEMLAKTLEDMFFTPALNINGGNDQTIQPPKLLDATSEFALTYEDKEGDWMLVGDVPWGMFMNTLKRLKIMRTSDAKGLAPKFQERNEIQKARQYKR
ncbi:auxin-responsive protein IAA13 isoform X1 [Primulina tabacum]|uniref:auxin-responsive protein IAA13 isoform X1 n=1 Tax=Primulina tabacum TaxID=48773 RepID=UPI003F5A0B5B